MSQSTVEQRLLAELSDEERTLAMERYQIIAPLLKLPKPSKAQWNTAMEQGGCTRKTLRRWMKRFQQHGLAGLARQRRREQQPRRAVTAEMQQLIEALFLEHSHRTFKTVYRLVEAYANKEGIPVPSYGTVRNICQALPDDLVTMARYGEAAWRDQFEPVLRFESTLPNECWQMDHCLVDILVVDNSRQKVAGRPWLTVALDTFSRAVVGYYLSLTTPTSLTICYTLRRAILAKPLEQWPMCGVPKRLHIDRGADFRSKHLEQVSVDLNIQLSFATPYLARAKGKIERFFSTLNQQLWCELPGYVGSHPQDRPPEVTPSLTLQEAESYLLGYLLNRYHQQTHGSTGQTPLARWQHPDFTPLLPADERQLDLLLMNCAERIVQRTGIRFYHLTYWHPDLVPLIGQRILLRYDPEHIADVVIYHANQLVCVASAAKLDGLDVTLADWRALQSRQRRSLREVVSLYRNWLDAKRDGLVPILEPDEVSLAILMERAMEEGRDQREVALYPAERPPYLLPIRWEERDV